MAARKLDSRPDRRARIEARRTLIGDDLPLRAAAGAALMAFALAVAWVGGFPFQAFWLLASAGVVWEWQRLVGGEREAARVGAGVLTLAASAPLALNGAAMGPLVVLCIGAVLTGALADPGRRIWAGGGVLYAGALVVGLTLLRGSPAYGLAAVLWLFAVVWGTDVAAYFGGRLIGGAKLWPSVSPSKTWSGALTGLFLSALIGALTAVAAAPSGVRWGPMLVMGLVVSAVSQAGDLFESAMKRRAGVKDSSGLIPGHGGLMDRLDALVAATAIAAALAGARSSGVWIAPGLFQW